MGTRSLARSLARGAGIFCSAISLVLFSGTVQARPDAAAALVASPALAAEGPERQSEAAPAPPVAPPSLTLEVYGPMAAAPPPAPAIAPEVTRRGRRMETAGWVLTGMGALFFVSFVGVAIADRCTAYCDSDEGYQRVLTFVVGLPLIGASVVFLAAGLPLALVGRRKQTRPPGALTLDLRGPRRHRLAERSGRPTLSLAPTFFNHGGGLGVHGRF